MGGLWRRKRVRSARLLDRDGVFFQSRGAFRITRKRGPKRLYWSDWFHTVLHFSTKRVLFLITAMYFLGFLVFAVAYYIGRHSCGMEIHSFSDAFMFSVTTMMTIGYTSFWNGQTGDSLFDGCFLIVFLVSLQSVIGTVLDAVCIGLVYDRLSRATNRANTILFSDKAIIRREGDDLTFLFRVAELRKHNLNEVHIRCVAVGHVLGSTGLPVVYFKATPMRIFEPDDELGAMLLLVLPTDVKHVLSFGESSLQGGPPRSPLLPPVAVLKRYRERPHAAEPDPRRVIPPSASNQLRAFGTIDDDHRSLMEEAKGSSDSEEELRQVKDLQEREEEVRDTPRFAAVVKTVEPPPGTPSSVPDHPFPGSPAINRGPAKNQSIHTPLLQPLPTRPGYSGEDAEESDSSLPPRDPTAHPGLRTDLLRPPSPLWQRQFPTYHEIERYWKETELEVVVLIEGIESTTSDTTQARHSYNINDLIFGSYDFENCVQRETDGSCTIDFARFHNVTRLQGMSAHSVVSTE